MSTVTQIAPLQNSLAVTLQSRNFLDRLGNLFKMIRSGQKTKVAAFFKEWEKDTDVQLIAKLKHVLNILRNENILSSDTLNLLEEWEKNFDFHLLDKIKNGDNYDEDNQLRLFVSMHLACLLYKIIQVEQEKVLDNQIHFNSLCFMENLIKGILKNTLPLNFEVKSFLEQYELISLEEIELKKTISKVRGLFNELLELLEKQQEGLTNAQLVFFNEIKDHLKVLNSSRKNTASELHQLVNDLSGRVLDLFREGQAADLQMIHLQGKFKDLKKQTDANADLALGVIK